MKNSNDTIGNRTRDLPTCSAVPQPTAPPRENKKRYEVEYRLLFYVGAKLGLLHLGKHKLRPIHRQKEQ